MKFFERLRLIGGGLLLSGLLLAPVSAETPPVTTVPSAELWVRSSAEYRAMGYQTYNIATDKLAVWAEMFEQGEDGLAYLPGSERPVAIVLDLDETVVDNSGFQAFAARTGASYNPELWNAWVHFQAINERAGALVPGAKEFLATAKELGVTPIYISNRMVGQEQPTIELLEKAGVCVDGIEDRLFFRLPSDQERARARAFLEEGEVDDETIPGLYLVEGEGLKETRRQIVKQDYDVVAYFGDVLGDFFPFLVGDHGQEGLAAARRGFVDEHQDRWGRNWFHFPNPMYGSWAPGDAIPKDGIAEALEDYGFEIYLRARKDR